jgi:hypothetical protein
LVLTRILTIDFFSQLLDETRARFADTTEIDLQLTAQKKALAQTDREINNLLELVVTFGAQSAGPKIVELEAKRTGLEIDIRKLETHKAAAHVEISPEALGMALDAWRGQITQARQGEEIRTLQNLLARFVGKIELGYNQAKIWYSYPLDGFDNSNCQTRGWGHLTVECQEAVIVQWE